MGDDDGGERGDRAWRAGHAQVALGVGRAQSDEGGVGKLDARQRVGGHVEDEVVVLHVGSAQVNRDPRGVKGAGRVAHQDAVDAWRVDDFKSAVAPVGPEREAHVLRRWIGEGYDVRAPRQVDAVSRGRLHLTGKEVAGHQVEVQGSVAIERPFLVDDHPRQPGLHQRLDVEAQPGRAADLDAVEPVLVGGVLVPLMLAANPHRNIWNRDAVGVAKRSRNGEGGCIGYWMLDIGSWKLDIGLTQRNLRCGERR